MSSKTLIRNLVLFMLLSLPLIVFASGAALWFIPDTQTIDTIQSQVEFVVHPGATIHGIAPDLERSGLVVSGKYVSWRYRIASKLGIQNSLQAGTYLIPTGLRPSEVLEILTMGSHKVYRTITIPPGRTSLQLAEIIEQSGLAMEEDVLSAIKSLASEYPIIQTEAGLEGYLFPDTYRIEPPLETSVESSQRLAEQIITVMADRYFLILDEVAPSWRDMTPAQLREKATLASIVEREYKVEVEAPMIAAVFLNRIHEGWPLQSCATVAYTIMDTPEGEAFRDEYLTADRRIFYHFLDIPSDYNTYHIRGLPPGPIANPGRVALEATFYPAQSDAMFFVVKDSVAGTHTFTRTLADHNLAKSSYLDNFGKD